MIETPNKIIQTSIDIIKLPTSSGLKIRGVFGMERDYHIPLWD